MKRIVPGLLLSLTALASVCAEEARPEAPAEPAAKVQEAAPKYDVESLRRLFNARLAEDAEHFATAALAVRKLCAPETPRSLRILAQYALYLVADDPDLPAEVRDELTDEVLAEYGHERNRTAIEARARGARGGENAEERKSNPFASYLLSLDAQARAERLAEKIERTQERIADLEGAAGTDAEKPSELATLAEELKKAKTDMKRADDERIRRLKEAERGNNVQALNELGVLMVERARIRLVEANEDLRQALERGAPEETLKVARKARDHARNCLAQARKSSFKLFQRAADLKDVNGLCNFGTCLMYGYGTKGARADSKAALGYIREAAGSGHPQALNLLGECYAAGEACERDPQGAAANFRKSADLGNMNGLYNYGRCLLYGLGVERDPKAAATYLRLAARRRHVEAMYLYAETLIDEEEPVERLSDEKAQAEREARRKRREHEAITWWFYAATEQQHAPSMVRLAECFLDGKGVEAPRETAGVYWLYRAAMDYQDTSAMMRLADCCDRGLGGLTASHDDANWWRTRAKAQEGDRHARIWLTSHDPRRFERLRLRTDRDVAQ